MSDLGLCPLDVHRRPRTHTFRVPSRGLVSRIDDVLTTTPMESLQQWTAQISVTTHGMEGSNTDHDALLVQAPWAALGLQPPITLPMGPHQPPQRVLRLPMTHDDQTRLTLAVQDRMGARLARLGTRLDTAVTVSVRPHWDRLEADTAGAFTPLRTVGTRCSRDYIDDAARELTEILQQTHQTALDVCGTKMTNPGGRKRPVRMVHRKWRALAKWRAELAEWRRNPNRGLPQELLAKIQEVRAETAERPGASGHEAQPSSGGERQGHVPAPGCSPTPEEAGRTDAALKREQRKIARDEQRLADAEAARGLQTLMTTRRKVANRVVQGRAGAAPPTAMRVLHNPATGKMTESAQEVLEVLERWAAPKVAAPQGATNDRGIHAKRGPS